MSSLEIGAGGAASLGAATPPATGFLASLANEESFHPRILHSLAEAEVPGSLIEQLVCKYLSVTGTATDGSLADQLLDERTGHLGLGEAVEDSGMERLLVG